MELDLSSTGRASLFDRAAATDAAYFDMGAQIDEVPGGSLAWMPGLTALPAGAVAQRVDAAMAARGGADWVDEIERAFGRVGAPLARIYLNEQSAADELLRNAGYAQRPELVFTHAMSAEPESLELRRVENDADWARKLRLHEEADRTPDGHPSTASDWVELERRKAAHGLETYLAILDDEVVGGIGAVRGDRILRFKNILIHPAFRRRGLGRAMLEALAAIGRESGIFEQTVFAVRGNAGERLYRACGMQVAGTLVEWSKPIGRSQR